MFNFKLFSRREILTKDYIDYEKTCIYILYEKNTILFKNNAYPSPHKNACYVCKYKNKIKKCIKNAILMLLDDNFVIGR